MILPSVQMVKSSTTRANPVTARCWMAPLLIPELLEAEWVKIVNLGPGDRSGRHLQRTGGERDGKKVPGSGFPPCK